MPRKPLILVGALALATAGCASVNTEPDEVALVYNGAAGSATKFERCIPPSSREEVSVSDNTWTYPAGQMAYDFTGTDKTDAPAIRVAAKGGEMDVPGVANFSLNTMCEVLRFFHDDIGRRRKAYLYGTDDDPSDAGWNDLVNSYFRNPLKRAMDAAAQGYSWEDLYLNDAVRKEWERKVGEFAAQEITRFAGRQFFCQPNYTPPKADENGKTPVVKVTASPGADPNSDPSQCGTIVLSLQKPRPDPKLLEKLTAKEAARLQNEAQKVLNTTVDTELESMEKQVDVLGREGYVQKYAIDSGKAIVIVGGGGVNVNPGQK